GRATTTTDSAAMRPTITRSFSSPGWTFKAQQARCYHQRPWGRQGHQEDIVPDLLGAHGLGGPSVGLSPVLDGVGSALRGAGGQAPALPVVPQTTSERRRGAVLGLRLLLFARRFAARGCMFNLRVDLPADQDQEPGDIHPGEEHNDGPNAAIGLVIRAKVIHI